MTRSILIGAAAIAAAIVPLAQASAQNGDIIVSVPAPRPADRQWNGVHPRKLLVANVAVYTGDLNLRTGYGRDVLDQRVRLAADTACDQLDGLESTGFGSAMNPDMGDCRHMAMKNAQPQVRTAIRLAYG